MNSIRTHLVISHLLIAALVLLAMGLLLNGLVNSYLIQEARDTLTLQGQNMARLFAVEMLTRGFGPFWDDRLQLWARTTASMINAEFIVVSPQGEPLIASLREDLTEDLSALLTAEPLQQTLRDGTIQSTQWRTEEGDPLVSVFVPITLAERDTPVGVVVLFQSVTAATEAGRDIFRIVLQTAVAALALALIASFFFARRISRPAEELSDLARALGRGELARRAPVRYVGEFSQLARQLNEMAEQLENLLTRRTHFFAMISHEIRTPVTTIRGFVQALQEGLIPPEEQDDYLATVLGETNRIERLLGDLLQLERLEAGEMSLEFAWIDGDTLLREAIHRAHGRGTDHPSSPRIELQLGSHSWDVWADDRRLQQVLANLLDNAITFSPPDSTITVGYQPEGRQLQFWVRDEGPGIPEGDQERIFERFYRSSTAPRDRGTGLGLAISKEIIERHGGQLWADNHPQGGAMMSFTLPRWRTT